MRKFGRDKFQNCLRIFSMSGDWNLVKTLFENVRIISRRGNWNLVKTIFENVLEYFQGEAIGVW